MISKVVIAAAGKGTRMLDLVSDKPKSLIEVSKKPFLYYILKNLKEAGLTEQIIVVGYKKERMEEFADQYKDEFQITLVDQFKHLGEDEYGTLCPIKCVRKFVGDKEFVCVYGDNLYSPTDLKNIACSDEFNYIAGVKHDHPERCGVLFEEDGKLKKIIEKPKTFVGNLVNTGLYKFTPEIFKVLDLVNRSERGEFELTDAITLLAKQDKVKVKMIQDYWLDLGQPSDIEKLESFLQK